MSYLSFSKLDAWHSRVGFYCNILKCRRFLLDREGLIGDVSATVLFSPFERADPMSQPNLTPSLAKVKKGALCAGCGGCAAIAPDAISMAMSPTGYLRPVQTAEVTSDQDRAIAAICPGLGQTVEAAGRTDDVLWGPYVEMLTGWSTDSDLRHTGSSGAGLSAVLVHLLKSGQVDAVLQITADPAHVAGNITTISRSVEEVKTSAGSRYAPSTPLAGIAPLLDGSETFAFVGKPCDVAALRALSKIDARVDQRFPVMVSFFCAGVPSIKGGEAVIEALGAPFDQVTSFRYRGMGWPGHATATLKDGTSNSMTYADSWGDILSSKVQHRCKVCADGTGKAADIVCADAWHCDENGYPLFEEEDGISLIVARTAKGKSIIDSARDAKDLETAPFDISTLPAIQVGQNGRRRALQARLLGLRLTGRAVPKYKGLKVGQAAKLNTLKGNFKNFAGMVQRVVKGRIKD
jgi:coenzyme F420 hydrogenase subunit beta